MRKFGPLLLTCILGTTYALGSAGSASLIQVKHHKKDPRVQQHKAHKATKHKAPKRPHNQA